MMRLLLFIFLTLLVGASCTRLKNLANNYPQDNWVENAIEDVIEKKLELPEGSIDLSPGTPEK